jgi:hypothetical protein
VKGKLFLSATIEEENTLGYKNGFTLWIYQASPTATLFMAALEAIDEQNPRTGREKPHRPHCAASLVGVTCSCPSPKLSTPASPP